MGRKAAGPSEVNGHVAINVKVPDETRKLFRRIMAKLCLDGELDDAGDVSGAFALLITSKAAELEIYA